MFNKVIFQNGFKEDYDVQKKIKYENVWAQSYNIITIYPSSPN